MHAGYSPAPLWKKLGLKPGLRACAIGAPAHYEALLADRTPGIRIGKRLLAKADFIHCFATKRRELESRIGRLKKALDESGMLWLSWPKGSSKIETDLSDGVVREIGLASGLVDIKVCAVDQDWSGLKFVYRVKDRGKGEG